MRATVFVDTNVLVYARDASEPDKQLRAATWMQHLWATRLGRLSVQVLQEFYVTVTGKLDPGLPAAEARADVRALWTWRPVPVDGRVLESAWTVEDRFGLSWWDAQIVAAAQLADCRYLLTEGLQANQEFGALRVVNPFQTAPDALAGER
jgi:predicted nucleic acid-binding protein